MFDRPMGQAKPTQLPIFDFSVKQGEALGKYL